MNLRRRQSIWIKVDGQIHPAHLTLAAQLQWNRDQITFIDVRNTNITKHQHALHYDASCGDLARDRTGGVLDNHKVVALISGMCVWP